MIDAVIPFYQIWKDGGHQLGLFQDRLVFPLRLSQNILHSPFGGYSQDLL